MGGDKDGLGVCMGFPGIITGSYQRSSQHSGHAYYLQLSFDTTDSGSQISNVMILKQLTAGLGVFN